MDYTLQKHGAKHVYRVPEGLRELCTDISREVLRAQPKDIYCFIADYVDALLITRENAKVAVKLVNNIILGSESIVGILYRTGLSMEQIALASTRIQKAFRAYLDVVDIQPIQVCGDKSLEEQSRSSVRNILEATGAPWEKADKAATIIQAAFRGHYERLLMEEEKGEIQWHRAVTNTLQILRKAGASQEEASKAAVLIQSAYRGYYARRNLRAKILESADEEEAEGGLMKPRQTIQAVAWLDMMYENSGLTPKQAEEAAIVIQSAYRGYRVRRDCHKVKRLESSKSMVVEAILDNLRQRVFDKVLSQGDATKRFGTPEEVQKAAGRIQEEFKARLRQSQITAPDDEEIYEADGFDNNEEAKDEDFEEEDEAATLPEESVPTKSIDEPLVPEGSIVEEHAEHEKFEEIEDEDMTKDPKEIETSPEP